ncbi:hypothetical protein HHI36_021285 [Cryptolaemus montrouzieri]|uniref:SCP domain-containing protein n=1 Tax=Cryptolaemus montrouzieri TaxID=559131 RepID=A0ABD2MWP2_9CUCU
MLKRHIFFIFAYAIPQFLSKTDTDYCKLPCNKEIHTVCYRKHKCGLVKGCESIKQNLAFREHMLHAHNDVRNQIASGEEKGSYGNTGATNMLALSYDLELEYIASCWAHMCKTLEHDKCRSTKRWSAGQNIFWGYNANETEAAVKGWFGEIKDFTDAKWLEKLSRPGDPGGYPNDQKQRGHFTQVVWAATQYIGCARVRYGKDNKETQLICNYGPAGNVLGASIYKMAADESEIASECGGDKNDVYTSLCGSIEPVPSDEPWASSTESQCNLVLLELSVLSISLKFNL